MSVEHEAGLFHGEMLVSLEVILEEKLIKVALKFGNSYKAINRLIAGSNSQDFWYLSHNHAHK